MQGYFSTKPENMPYVTVREENESEGGRGIVQTNTCIPKNWDGRDPNKIREEVI